MKFIVAACAGSLVAVAESLHAANAPSKLKDVCSGPHANKAQCAKAVAKSIVSESAKCFKAHVGDETAYEGCVSDFCARQCGGGGGSAGCRGICGSSGNALFLRLQSAHSPPVDPVKLKEQAREAAGEQAAALADLRRAQDRMSTLNHKIAERAAREIRSGDSAKGKQDLAAAQKLEKMQDEIKEHLAKVEMFRGMAYHQSRRVAVSSVRVSFLQRSATDHHAPEDELAKEMTHDLEMNFNKIAPFGKEDTAKELQDHAAKTQDTLVDAVENAEVAEIKRAVFRALTRLRAATIKEFDTIARLETQAIDAYNDAHHYRAENPLAHLHEDEAPVETDKLKSFH